MKILVVFLLLSGYINLLAQYHPDRHNTSYDAAWLSCQPKESPNAARSLSHWIMYDFSQVYSLGKMTIWNFNAGGETKQGIKRMAIDYSIDGVNWTEFVIADLPQANASGYYLGEDGPDLSGIEARYILITALDNYGGECAGLSEIRIQLEEMTTEVADLSDLQVTMEAVPNPFVDNTVIKVDGLSPGNFQYQITDIGGKLLQRKSTFLSAGDAQIPIDLSNVPEGIYLFSLSDGNRIKSIRIDKVGK